MSDVMKQCTCDDLVNNGDHYCPIHGTFAPPYVSVETSATPDWGLSNLAPDQMKAHTEVKQSLVAKQAERYLNLGAKLAVAAQGQKDQTGRENGWPDLVYGDKQTFWGNCYSRNGESKLGGNINAWYESAVFWRNRAEGVPNKGEDLRVGGSPARSVEARVDLDVLAEKLDAVVCTLPRYAYRGRNIKAFRDVLEAALTGSQPQEERETFCLPCPLCGGEVVTGSKSPLVCMKCTRGLKVVENTPGFQPSEPHDITCIFLSSRGLEECNCSAQPSEETRAVTEFELGQRIELVWQYANKTSLAEFLRRDDIAKWLYPSLAAPSDPVCRMCSKTENQHTNEETCFEPVPAAPSDTGREQPPDNERPCPACEQTIRWNGKRGWYHVEDSNCSGIRDIPWPFAPVVAPAQAQPERPYTDGLYERLKDRKYAIEYLKACLDNGAFESALEDVLRASGPQKGQGWVSVEEKDKLPSPTKDVLILTPSGAWDKGFLSGNGQWYDRFGPVKVTHFMFFEPHLMRFAAPPSVPAGPQEEKK